MQVNFFYEIKVRDEIYLTWKIVSNLRNCNFYDSETLREHSWNLMHVEKT